MTAVYQRAQQTFEAREGLVGMTKLSVLICDSITINVEQPFAPSASKKLYSTKAHSHGVVSTGKGCSFVLIHQTNQQGGRGCIVLSVGYLPAILYHNQNLCIIPPRDLSPYTPQQSVVLTLDFFGEQISHVLVLPPAPMNASARH